VSRTRNRLRGRTGKGTVREALVLRIVTAAELKRLSGSRPKRDGRQVREMLTVARRPWSPPRCTEAPYPRLWVQLAERGKPDTLSASSADRVAQAQVRGKASRVKDREEAKAVL
jgi:hypothetical protein